MTRKECLDKAAECVLQDRASQYGGPEDNFGRIAKLWSTYTGTVLDGIDVAMMMTLLKVARIRNNKSYEDGYIDLAGYAACGAELAGVEKAREDATRRWGAEYKKLRAEADGEDVKSADVVVLWKHKPKAEAEAEGGCFQNGNNQPEEPEFKPGDSLLVTMPEGEEVHCVYVGESSHPGCCCVRYESGDLNGDTDDTVPIDQVRRAPAPKAEGCEELVFDEGRMRESMPGIVPQNGPSDFDAPQTTQELYSKILESNPATYGRAHKPTGEELAEMAEEEGNAGS